MIKWNLNEEIIIFTDSLKKDRPYISEEPRNHESLFLITDGALLYEKNGTKQVVQKGHIGYIQRGSKDKSGPFNCDEVSYIAINFNFSDEDLSPTLPFKTDCSSGVFYYYRKLFNRAFDTFYAKTPASKVICKGIIFEIIGYLYNEMVISDNKQKKLSKIQKSVDFMMQNYGDSEIRISELSKICEMSEKNFRRIFFDVYNKTPFAFLQEFRINAAEILLANSNKNISEIAVQCGFSDVYSFSHCFKKHRGMAPNAYKMMGVNSGV